MYPSILSSVSDIKPLAYNIHIGTQARLGAKGDSSPCRAHIHHLRRIEPRLLAPNPRLAPAQGAGHARINVEIFRPTSGAKMTHHKYVFPKNLQQRDCVLKRSSCEQPTRIVASPLATADTCLKIIGESMTTSVGLRSWSCLPLSRVLHGIKDLVSTMALPSSGLLQWRVDPRAPLA